MVCASFLPLKSHNAGKHELVKVKTPITITNTDNSSPHKVNKINLVYKDEDDARKRIHEKLTAEQTDNPDRKINVDLATAVRMSMFKCAQKINNPEPKAGAISKIC